LLRTGEFIRHVALYFNWRLESPLRGATTNQRMTFKDLGLSSPLLDAL